ncbi:MAG: signal peptide peptidase SppA [Planctomycetota bacterium]
MPAHLFGYSHRWLLVGLCSLALLTPAAGVSAKEAAKKADDSKSEDSKSTSSKKVRYAQIILSGGLPEGPEAKGPFGDGQAGLRKAVARFDRAAEDKSIEGVILQLEGAALGFGKASEVRNAIKRVQKAGKKVHAVIEVATTMDYLVAAACDEVVMPESGYLVAPGVRLEPVFYRGFLNMLGVKPQFLHMGDAKGAGESFTRKKWSQPVRDNLDALAGDLYQHMVETIAMDRPITETQAREAIDVGLLTATQAKELGLVDRLAYGDEVKQGLAKQHNTSRLVYVQNYGKKKVETSIGSLMNNLFGGAKRTSGTGNKIAVVYAVGPIMTGESEQDLFGASSLGSTTIVEALREADDDDNVKAIVLRVDSPGGSAVASDLMWRKLRSIEKPVIASMGNVAASGGYYISMGCDKILAEPGTITGSIGVVSGKFALRGMYQKLGLSTDLVSRGKNSGIFSSTRPWNESEQAAMMRLMEDCYEQFTSKAADGRGMSVEELKALASGKVYTGRQAKANGLVDDLGTLRDAIQLAKKMAGLKEEEKVRLDIKPEAPELFNSLFGAGDGEKEVRIGIDGLGLPSEVTRAARQAMLWGQLLEREPVGLFLPFDLQVE